jgi:hypothetical protein
MFRSRIHPLGEISSSYTLHYTVSSIYFRLSAHSGIKFVQLCFFCFSISLTTVKLALRYTITNECKDCVGARQHFTSGVCSGIKSRLDGESVGNRRGMGEQIKMPASVTLYPLFIHLLFLEYFFNFPIWECGTGVRERTVTLDWF